MSTLFHRVILLFATVELAGCALAQAPTPATFGPGSGFGRSGIEVHPELYLGWKQGDRPPEEPLLPWPLLIKLRAVDQAGTVLAGPMTVTAYEPVLGASFRKRAETITTAAEPDDRPAETNRTFIVSPNVSVDVHQVDFAALVRREGANSIRIRCFVSIIFQTGDKLDTYDTLTTVECRPGRETTLAVFPDLTVLIQADWSRQSPYDVR